MSDFKCTNCGRDLLFTDKFCPGCGSKVADMIQQEEAATVPEEVTYEAPVTPAFEEPVTPTYEAPVTPTYEAPVTPVYEAPVTPAHVPPVYEQPQAPVQADPVKTKSAGKVVASVFICIFMFLFGFYSLIGFMFRTSLSKNALKKAVSKIDFTEVKTENIGINSESDNLVEYISDLYDVSESDIKKALKSDLVTEEIGNVIGIYADYIFEGKGDGKITEDEIEDIVIAISKSLDGCGDISEITEEIVDEIDIEALNLDAIITGDEEVYEDAKDISFILDITHIAFSYVALIVAGAVALLLFVLYAIINKKAIVSGVIFMVIGFVGIAIAVVTIFGKMTLDSSNVEDALNSVIKTVLYPVRIRGFIYGGGTLFVGFLAVLISGIVSSAKKKKALN